MVIQQQRIEGLSTAIASLQLMQLALEVTYVNIELELVWSNVTHMKNEMQVAEDLRDFRMVRKDFEKC